MMDRKDDWAGSNFAIHLWWHTALYHLDLGEIDKVLEIYDTGVRNKRSGHLAGGAGRSGACYGG